MLHFYLPGEETPLPVAHGPEGRPVEVLTYDDKNETLQQAVMAILHRLIEEEHIPASAIAVLTPSSQRTSLLKTDSLRSPQEITLRWSDQDAGTNQVRLETIYRFKGLERPVVILAEIERRLAQERSSVDGQRLLYVACSRAQHHLIVLLPKRVPVQLSRLFGP